MTTTPSEIDVLFPEGKTLSIGGESITIKPLTFGQIPKASKMVAPIIQAMSKSELAGDSIMNMAGNWVDILAIGGEDLINLIGWAIGKDRDWFDTLQMDDGVELVKSVIEVNSDFFIKKVLARLNLDDPQNQGDGATLSPSSLEPVTPDAT